MKFFLFFMLLGTLWLPLTPTSSWAGEAWLYIDPETQASVLKTQVPYPPQVLLGIEDLPNVSQHHQAITLQNKSFKEMALSPNGESLAFIIKGLQHQWSGILDLKGAEPKELSSLFEGKMNGLYWSEDSRFLATEGQRSKNITHIEIFDLQSDQHCRLDGKAIRSKFLNPTQPWWDPESQKIFFKVEYNNNYRKAVGLKPKTVAKRIGEADLRCDGVKLYSVKAFMESHPGWTQNPSVSELRGNP